MTVKESREKCRPDIQPLVEQIRANCHRSDALFAGSFSLCGLLLRLRDYYKWEQGFPPYTEAEAPDVLAWIEKREHLWETLENEPLRDFEWLGQTWDPFDSDAINRRLESHGLYYGAGYAVSAKPSFILAEVLSVKKLGCYRVIYLGRELARDLFTVPAQTRGDEILARTRPLAAYLWDTILHGGAGRSKAINLALSIYGLSRDITNRPLPDWANQFETMIEHEIEPFVRHEFGEVMEDTFPRQDWQAIVGGHPHSRIELMARNIKDLLADTAQNGRLEYIISERSVSSLGIFVALLDGMPARLFPEILAAFDRFINDQDWEFIDNVRKTVNKRAKGMAKHMLSLFHESRNHDRTWFAQKVERSFFEPLKL